MRPKPPAVVLDVIPEEREQLLALLAGLPAERWQAPTSCPGWTVHDLAAHLLGDDLGNLTGGRDGYTAEPFPASAPWADLVTFVGRRNDEWVRATRRLSPPLLVELLRWSGDRTLAWFCSLDLDAPGWAVAWAGPEPAPWWLHVAREYSERWVHQEQIREAVMAPGMRQPELFHPVLDTFVHALPWAYRATIVPEGTHVQLVVSGPAGGTWSLLRTDGTWRLAVDVRRPPACTVTVDEDTAWRCFTRGINREVARARMDVTGDPKLGRVLLEAVAIIA